MNDFLGSVGAVLTVLAIIAAVLTGEHIYRQARAWIQRRKAAPTSVDLINAIKLPTSVDLINAIKLPTGPAPTAPSFPTEADLFMHELSKSDEESAQSDSPKVDLPWYFGSRDDAAYREGAPPVENLYNLVYDLVAKCEITTAQLGMKIAARMALDLAEAFDEAIVQGATNEAVGASEALAPLLEKLSTGRAQQIQIKSLRKAEQARAHHRQGGRENAAYPPSPIDKKNED